jgi:predicted metal-dependent phosphoesterase TrpH
MRVDLHFHSKYSDGSFWPEELVTMAYEKEIEMIALTDHDTFEGVGNFLKATTKMGITGVPAIEIDFIDNNYGFKSELLGYFPEGHYAKTKEYISRFQSMRRKIVEISIEKAKSEFRINNLSVEELIKNKIGNTIPSHIYNNISLTKLDIYNYFITKKMYSNFESYPDFKNNFFVDKEFKDLSDKPEFSECIEIINKDGGYAVIAHPAYQFNKDPNKIIALQNEYKEKLMQAKKIGLWGLEIHAYDSSEEATVLNSIIHKIANECELNTTFGSDFHGKNHKNQREIGCVYGDFKGFKR